MIALVVYIIAGLYACWGSVHDTWWQRLLLVPLWMPMFGWALLCEFGDWWRSRGYRYPSD